MKAYDRFVAIDAKLVDPTEDRSTREQESLEHRAIGSYSLGNFATLVDATDRFNDQLTIDKSATGQENSCRSQLETR